MRRPVSNSVLRDAPRPAERYNGHAAVWVHVRASNTEPIARIIAEAPTKARAEELIAMAAKAAGL